jgi:rhomboid protease GluP
MTDQSDQAQNGLPHDDVRVKMPDNKPEITYVIMGFTIVVFVIQNLLHATFSEDLFFYFFGKINTLILDGQVWRLITPVFLHSSVLHVAMNMYALYIIGRRLERFYGHGRLLLLYFLSAFSGNVLSFVLTSASSLGASTAIFGLLAAEGIFIFQNRKLFGQMRTRQMMINLGVILAINLIYGFMSTAQVDNMGHIGGLLGGIFFAWKAGPLLRISGQPPLLEIQDVRKSWEILLASAVVLIGFTIIASIPFITGY